MKGGDGWKLEVQVRAMTGLPLPTPRLHSPTVMLNLLGDLWFDASGAERSPAWDAVLVLPGTHLHLYGKTSARRGRQMGHLNIAAATAAGELVGLPTETVYGLGARADDDAAVARIFAAKGRPADHPLIVHVLDVADAMRFAAELPPVARRLM